jgi:hypothetical protein
MKGDTDICPICSRVYTIENKLHLDKILECLKRGIRQQEPYFRALQNYEKQNRAYDFWRTCRYECTWNNEKVLLSLYPLLHIHQDHAGTFKRLVESNILSGELPKFLYDKEYLKKVQQPPMLKAEEPKEQLSKGIVIKRRENLSKGEQALVEWLKRGTVSKE